MFIKVHKPLYFRSPQPYLKSRFLHNQLIPPTNSATTSINKTWVVFKLPNGQTENNFNHALFTPVCSILNG